MSYKLSECVAIPGRYLLIIYCDCCGKVVNNGVVEDIPKGWWPVSCTKCEREYEGLEHYDGRYDHLKIVEKPIIVYVEDVIDTAQT